MKIFKKLISFLVMGCLQVGLTLFGWGFNDISGFFKHPARVTIVLSIMLMMLISAFVMEKTEVKFRRKGKKKYSKELITGVVLPTLFTMLILVISPYSDSHNFLVISKGDVLRYFGLAVFFIGAVFSIWGPAHLGKQFSVGVIIQEEHKLVTDGPFRYIRHPRYLGICLWLIGIAMIFCSIIGLALAIVITILFIWRICLEEDMLYKEFSKEWEAYISHTKKLIPFVY
jgi:protein-S-isoprenylcysteine O-methyltransferase Ste14